MTNRPYSFILIVGAALVLQGCASGYNHSLVKNSGSIGFDANSLPGKVEMAVSSQTSGMTPTFEGGQTVPLLANVSSKSNKMGQFFNGSSSTIITGDAAYTMSYLYADCNRDVSAVKDIPQVKLSKKPEAVPGPGEVKPAIFETSAMMGANLTFGRQAPVALNAAQLGFNRQESVVAPITVTSGGAQNYVAGSPSLIATLDHRSDLENKANIAGEKLQYNQHFATGAAADNLALRSDIRRNTLQRISPYMQDSFCEDNFETKSR